MWTGFYGSNDRTNSVNALKERHLTVDYVLAQLNIGAWSSNVAVPLSVMVVSRPGSYLGLRSGLVPERKFTFQMLLCMFFVHIMYFPLFCYVVTQVRLSFVQ